jgi:RimJ/RimL family protein N-acetyltransferase
MTNHRIGPETERLEHRSLSLDDADAFFALNSHPDVMRLTGEPAMRYLDDAKTAISNYPDFDTVGHGRWGCVLKETQTLIGFCGLKYLSELDEVDVGYRFLPQYWGQGQATEACSASLTYGFDVIELKRIIGLVLPENEASIRVLEKVGMQQEEYIVIDGFTAIRYAVHR